MRDTRVRSLGREDPLEEEMATHSSILAWRIPWMEEPGGLQSTGSHRVGHDRATSLSLSPGHGERKKMSPYRTHEQRRIHARERYLGWKRSLSRVNGGLTHRIKVGSNSTRPAARAVARKITALLLFVPAANGVRLEGWEVWLHPKSRRTPTVKAESLKAPGHDSSFSK